MKLTFGQLKSIIQEAFKSRKDELSYFVIATKDASGREMYLARNKKDVWDDGPGLYDKDKGKQPEGDNWTPSMKAAKLYTSVETANSGLVAQKRNGTKCYIKKVM